MYLFFSVSNILGLGWELLSENTSTIHKTLLYLDHALKLSKRITAHYYIHPYAQLQFYVDWLICTVCNQQYVFCCSEKKPTKKDQ